ncbi:hypothetical protein ET899_19070, partial [Salmonella enterica subsp. enterica serovar Typhimurium]|nr:hypothetical protein [Salmonella enterica subsp. enterica serovar Typhimurium]
MRIQFISEDTSTPCISVHTDTSLLWTQTVMRKPLVLWTAVWMLLLRHISGRNYRNGYSKISSVNTW